jgi:hypothetical protein
MSPQLAQAIRAARWCSPPVREVAKQKPAPAVTPAVSAVIRPQWRTPILTLIATWTDVIPLPAHVPSLHRIIREVSEKHNLTLAEVCSRRRAKAFRWARYEYFYRAVIETEKSYVYIARVLGRHHKSLYDGIRAYCYHNKVPLPRGIKWDNRGAPDGVAP